METGNAIHKREAGFGVFLSGRLVALAVLLGFQIALAAGLSVGEYAAYAVMVAGASLLQTLSAFGVPRFAALHLSRLGEDLTHAAGRRLIIALVGLRLAAASIGLALCAGVLAALSPGWAKGHEGLILAGSVYALATALLADADAMALALGLQRPSRIAAIGEPSLRLAGLGALLAAHAARAEVVLGLSAATAGLFSLGLLAWCVIAAGRGEDRAGARPRLPVRDFAAVALGGQAGTLSWLATSPAVVRLIAAQALPTPAFAAFSFAQTLVVSLQRYTPGTLLLPFLEPALLAGAGPARGRRLRTALGLIVEIDALAVAAANVAVAAAGPALTAALSHGRYPGAATVLPWLLALIVVNTAHRTYEIAAIAVGAPGALVRGLGFSLAWLAAMVLSAPWLGLWSLLIGPLGDAVTRLAVIQRRIGRFGGGSLADGRVLARLAALTVLIGVVAWGLAQGIGPALGARLALGTACSLGLLAAALALRPLKPVERALMGRIFFARRRQGRRDGGPLRVVVLTPLGEGGQGGVDRLMDALRLHLVARTDVAASFLTTRGPSRWLSPAVTLMALGRFAAALVGGRVDLVHINLGADVSFWRKSAFALLCRCARVPYAIHLHGSGFDRFRAAQGPFGGRAIERLLGGAARVIVLGGVWREVVERAAPRARRRIIVLPNAAEAIPRSPRPPGPVHILFLGRLGPRKGVDTLIAALARLPAHPPWRATLAGDGAAAEVHAALAAAGLEGKVEAPGWLGPAEARAALATADILALPSREENLPMAVVEAFAVGLAVVATPVGAILDLVIDGETGLLIPPGRADLLADALSRLIADPGLRAQLGDAAAARHARDLAIGPYVDALVAIWRRAAGRASAEEDARAGDEAAGAGSRAL